MLLLNVRKSRLLDVRKMRLFKLRNIYTSIGSLCFNFPWYSARYVEVERDIY